jgi:nucleotide-binding universal stress UspA family protein
MIDYPRKVLLATDGTEDSVMAGYAAVALADRAGAELHVVHVWHTASTAPSEAVVGRPAYLPSEPASCAERQARRVLERHVEGIEAAGGTVAVAHLRMGRPAPEVVALAADLDADLVVVGSGGPRAVATDTDRGSLGSVSEIIIRTAHCPVLVVPEEITRVGSNGGERTRERGARNVAIGGT